MNRVKFALLTASITLAMALTFSCSVKGGCKEPDSNGRIQIGGALSYEKCVNDAVEANTERCTSGGIWEQYNNAPEIGDCYCYAKPCEED